MSIFLLIRRGTILYKVYFTILTFKIFFRLHSLQSVKVCDYYVLNINKNTSQYPRYLRTAYCGVSYHDSGVFIVSRIVHVSEKSKYICAIPSYKQWGQCCSCHDFTVFHGMVIYFYIRLLYCKRFKP